MRNIQSRDGIVQDMNRRNAEYNRLAQEEFRRVSQNAAAIYQHKQEAQKRNLSNYANRLLSVRNECERKAQRSLMMSEAHQGIIRGLEGREKNIIDNLNRTMRLNAQLLQDLSEKSQALTNTLIPRSPIKPKTKKWQRKPGSSLNESKIDK